jgi:small-conductance mechanosensitive channel
MESKSSKIPLIAAIGVCIIFSWLVGYGWYRTFNSWTGSVPLAIFIGFIFAAIAVTLSLAIAKQRVQNPKNISTVFSYFFILILLSALGTINTLYFNVSGARIVQDEIKGAIQKINTLKNNNSVCQCQLHLVFFIFKKLLRSKQSSSLATA